MGLKTYLLRLAAAAVITSSAAAEPAAAQGPTAGCPAHALECSTARRPSPALDSFPGANPHLTTYRAPHAPRTAQAPTEQLVLGGLAGGALGLFGGAYLGYALEEAAIRAGSLERCTECWVTGGPILGAVILEPLLLPLGVHVANGLRGRYWTSALLSLGVTGLGFLLIEPTGGRVLVLIPVGQLYVSLQNERASARSRAQ